MNKKLIDRINHFDRFNTDKYIEVVNVKNGIESNFKKDEKSINEINSGCMNFIISLIFLVCLTSLVYILCFIGE